MYTKYKINTICQQKQEKRLLIHKQTSTYPYKRYKDTGTHIPKITFIVRLLSYFRKNCGLPLQPENHKAGTAAGHQKKFSGMERKNNRTFILIFLGMLTAFGPFVTDMYLPTLPSMADYFSTSASMVQLGLTASMIGLALGQLVFGPLSDRYGCNRKSGIHQNRQRGYIKNGNNRTSETVTTVHQKR